MAKCSRSAASRRGVRGTLRPFPLFVRWRLLLGTLRSGWREAPTPQWSVWKLVTGGVHRPPAAPSPRAPRRRPARARRAISGSRRSRPAPIGRVGRHHVPAAIAHPEAVRSHGHTRAPAEGQGQRQHGPVPPPPPPPAPARRPGGVPPCPGAMPPCLRLGGTLQILSSCPRNSLVNTKKSYGSVEFGKQALDHESPVPAPRWKKAPLGTKRNPC